MSSPSLAINNGQMPLLKQARADGKIAFFRHTKLIVRERKNRDATTINDQRSTKTTGAVGGVSAGERSDDGGNWQLVRWSLRLALVCRVSRELWLTLLARILLLVDMALRMAA